MIILKACMEIFVTSGNSIMMAVSSSDGTVIFSARALPALPPSGLHLKGLPPKQNHRVLGVCQ